MEDEDRIGESPKGAAHRLDAAGLALGDPPEPSLARPALSLARTHAADRASSPARASASARLPPDSRTWRAAAWAGGSIDRRIPSCSSATRGGSPASRSEAKLSRRWAKASSRPPGRSVGTDGTDGRLGALRPTDAARGQALPSVKWGVGSGSLARSIARLNPRGATRRFLGGCPRASQRHQPRTIGIPNHP